MPLLSPRDRRVAILRCPAMLACLAAVMTLAALSPSMVFAQTITRVNVRPDGTEPQWGANFPAISANGRVVSFASHSPDLVPGDTNDRDDIFVRDLDSGVTTRASVSSTGEQGNGYSDWLSALSADGRYVAFSSSSTNLVPGDTNGYLDVFVRDRVAATTTRVSVASDGSQADSSCYLISISPDGRYVTFDSGATTLVPGPLPETFNIYVHDRHTGVTTRGDVWLRSVDGRYAAFSSDASDIVPGDTNGFFDVFLRDEVAGTTTRISVPPWGGEANYWSAATDISDDGRVVVFVSGANNLAYGDWNNTEDVFAYDRVTNTITLVTAGPGGVASNGRSGGPLFSSPHVSRDGRYVVFESEASNLVVGDTNGTRDIFMHDLATRVTARVSLGAGGVQANQWSLNPAIDASGRYVAFSSDASNLVPGDSGVSRDIFVRDLDADGDGLLETWEEAFGLDPLVGSGNDGANGDPDGDGRTNAEESLAGTHPRGFHRRFLAEGASSLSLFDTRLALLNPGDFDAHVLLRFLEPTGSTSLWLPVGPTSRATVDAKLNARMLNDEFSTVVESDVEIVADRLMQWDASGYGAHLETAVATPAQTWYLAEGATHGTFDLFYLVQNANDTAAEVRVRYLTPGSVPIEKTYVFPANSRTNVWVDYEEFPAGSGNLLLANTEVSAVFEVLNGLPIIVERAMYAGVPGQVFGAGHESAGVTAPALEWFLAEGATHWPFDLYVLVANPRDEAAEVEARFLLPDGTVVSRQFLVGATSRFNIHVNSLDPALASTAVSTTVRSTNGVPIVVERAMWWGDEHGWYEAHNSPGATTTGTVWAIAEGEQGGARGVSSYILVANPTDEPAQLRVTALMEDGRRVRLLQDPQLPPHSRFNVDLGNWSELAGQRFGALVESVGITPTPIVVERAMYWNVGATFWAAGVNALATKVR